MSKNTDHRSCINISSQIYKEHRRPFNKKWRAWSAMIRHFTYLQLLTLGTKASNCGNLLLWWEKRNMDFLYLNLEIIFLDNAPCTYEMILGVVQISCERPIRPRCLAEMHFTWSSLWRWIRCHKIVRAYLFICFISRAPLCPWRTPGGS